MPQPLSGVLVLDFTTLLPGPLATLMLAEAGAEVIKIERPGGEDARRGSPPFDGVASGFALLNRGKQGLVLDLKDASGRERLMPLLARADVLVEQFRPGVMDRLGLGYEDVRKINPRLVYCSITGFGQAGPYAPRPGYDRLIQAMGGVMGLTGDPDGQPQKVGIPLADLFAGLY